MYIGKIRDKQRKKLCDNAEPSTINILHTSLRSWEFDQIYCQNSQRCSHQSNNQLVSRIIKTNIQTWRVVCSTWGSLSLCTIMATVSSMLIEGSKIILLDKERSGTMTCEEKNNRIDKFNRRTDEETKQKIGGTVDQRQSRREGGQLTRDSQESLSI